MSSSVELADAIVGLLNDPTNDFSFEFTAERRSAPLTTEELSELSNVKVYVFTGTTAKERLTRAQFQVRYKPIVVVQRPLDGTSQSGEQQSVDQLETLVEEIENVITDEDQGSLHFVGFDEENDRDPYDALALADLKVFARAITPEYLGWPA